MGEVGRKVSETCKTRHSLKLAGQDPVYTYIMKISGRRSMDCLNLKQWRTKFNTK